MQNYLMLLGTICNIWEKTHLRKILINLQQRDLIIQIQRESSMQILKRDLACIWILDQNRCIQMAAFSQKQKTF